jgi:REP element-mobilizing transposase RayT
MVKTSDVPKRIQRISRSRAETFEARHRYEHWLVDNQVYFITARCRDRYAAFASDQAKVIFWDRFDHYTREAGFTPWLTSLLDNHYHTLGYLRTGAALPKMMQRIHGSVAKLVNDLLPERREEFWRDAKGREYFDGCIRDEKQGRLAYRYTLTQGVRHRLVKDWKEYGNTRVNVELERAIGRALELDAFLSGVRYKRYLEGERPAR